MTKFHFRGFVSLLLSFSFLVVVISGLVLWLSHSPQTFGLAKDVWKHSHIFVSLLALVAGTLHLWLCLPSFSRNSEARGIRDNEKVTGGGSVATSNAV